MIFKYENVIIILIHHFLKLSVVNIMINLPFSFSLFHNNFLLLILMVILFMDYFLIILI